MNNLPAYPAALEPSRRRRPTGCFHLVGTNLGPLIAVGVVTALLSTAAVRVTSRGAGQFALAGVVGVPVLLVTATLALWLTQ